MTFKAAKLRIFKTASKVSTLDNVGLAKELGLIQSPEDIVLWCGC